MSKRLSREGCQKSTLSRANGALYASARQLRFTDLVVVIGGAE
jgi:hypothetical protein